MKINQLKTIIFIHILGFIFISCEKVIDVDLNSSNPVPVVDAKIFKDSTALVRLSYTSDYFITEDPQYIDNALVKIINQNNEIETLEYISNGYYKGTQLEGIVNSNYTLEIAFDDKEFIAESKLFPPTEILEFTFEETSSNNPTSNEVKYAPKIKFKSISDETNYFLLRFWINGKLDNHRIRMMEVKNPDETITYEHFRQRFDKDDMIKVRIYSIDEETRDYYQQLDDYNGNMMSSSTPYNAKSNFGPNIMGYFLASSFVEQSAIAQ